MKLRIYIPAVVVTIAFIFGCQTYKTITPAIHVATRTGVNIKKPINISIVDGRISPENSIKTIDTIISGLKNAYGDAIKFVPYFSPVEDSAVEIKIKLVEVGSQFGSRFITYTTVHNEIVVASTAIASKWGTAASSTIYTQPIYDVNFIAEGWWVGTSYLQITFLDNTINTHVTYNFPLVAEDIQSNTFGYKSAKLAAQNSWNKVSTSLINFIDAIIYNKTLQNK